MKQMMLKPLHFAAVCALAALIAISAIPVTAKAAEAESQAFTDVAESHWATEAISWAIQEKIVNGYTDGTFRPEQNVSEAEFLTMLLRGFGEEPASDGSSAHWADAIYEVVNSYNYPMQGAESAALRDKFVDRLYVAEVVVGANGEHYTGDDAIHYLLAYGYSKGKSSATIEGYEGSKPLTRAEAVQFIKNLKDAGMSELQARPEAPSDPAALPPLTEETGEEQDESDVAGEEQGEDDIDAAGELNESGIIGKSHIVIDYVMDDLQPYYPYSLASGESDVVWSLNFPFDVADMPYWDGHRIDYETGEEIPHGIAIDPETGRLTIGWYLWIGEFEVVASSSVDGSILAVQPVKLTYSNVENIIATNGSITLELFEEPEWFEYEWNGETHRIYRNIDEIEISRHDPFEIIEITSTEYDEDANIVTFQFEPFAVTDEEQTIILALGYVESTYLSAVVLTIPAAE